MRSDEDDFPDGNSWMTSSDGGNSLAAAEEAEIYLNDVPPLRKIKQFESSPGCQRWSEPRGGNVLI